MGVLSSISKTFSEIILLKFAKLKNYQYICIIKIIN